MYVFRWKQRLLYFAWPSLTATIMSDLPPLLRWIILGLLILIVLSVVGAVANVVFALLGIGLEILVLVLIAFVIVRVVDRCFG